MTGYCVCPYCTRRARWRDRAARRVVARVYRALLSAPYGVRWAICDPLRRAEDRCCAACKGRHIYKERRR